MIRLQRWPRLWGLMLLVGLVGCQWGAGTPTTAELVPIPTATRESVAIAPTGAVAATQSVVEPSSPTATLAPTVVAPTPAADPTSRLVQARELDRIGEWEQAIPLYESLGTDRTVGPQALYYLGILYYRQDRIVEAAQVWTAAIQRDPDGPLADPLRYRLARGLAAIGQHESALALFGTVDANTDTADPLVIQRIAESYSALGDEEAAIAQWQRLYEHPTALRVERSLAAQAVGDWYADSRQWEEAIEWYQNALELGRVESYRAELLLKIANAQEDDNELARARATWQEILDSYPTEEAALTAAAQLQANGRDFTPLELGDLYRAAGTNRVAAEYYIEALTDPDHAAYGHQGLAWVSEENGNISSAIEEWDKIITTHPEALELYAEAWYHIGRLESERSDTTAAFAAWNTLLQSYPESEFAPEALWRMGGVYRQRGDMATAISLWSTLATQYSTSPRTVTALWQSGLAHYGSGDYVEAEASFTQLALLDERPARAYLWAGKSAQAQGDEQAATRYWNQAIAADASDYYAIRAADLMQANEWQARNPDSYTLPTITSVYPFTTTAPPADLDDGYLEQGLVALLMGERGAAFDSFEVAIINHEDDPIALWQIAYTLYQHEIYGLASNAARQLIVLQGLTIGETPPQVGAIAYPLVYADAVAEAAADYDQDPLFVAAMIYQESRWEPTAASSAAARGLLQVIPDTGRWIATRLNDSTYSHRQLNRPVVALRYGTYYLDYVLTQFDDNPGYALAAYNGGPGNVRRWANEDFDLFLEQITFTETRAYVELIYSHYHAYNSVYR